LAAKPAKVKARFTVNVLDKATKEVVTKAFTVYDPDEACALARTAVEVDFGVDGDAYHDRFSVKSIFREAAGGKGELAC